MVIPIRCWRVSCMSDWNMQTTWICHYMCFSFWYLILNHLSLISFSNALFNLRGKYHRHNHNHHNHHGNKIGCVIDMRTEERKAPWWHLPGKRFFCLPMSSQTSMIYTQTREVVSFTFTAFVCSCWWMEIYWRYICLQWRNGYKYIVSRRPNRLHPLHLIL